MRRSRLTIVPMVALVFAVAAVAGTPGAGAALPPRISYDTTTGSLRAAALNGMVTATWADRSPYQSLSGGIVAAARPGTNGGSKVIGSDAVTGTTTFTISDAFFPLIGGQGSRVVFLPDGNASGPGDRDPTLNSVWFHDVASGTDHRLIRFTDSDRIPLNLATSPSGRLVAVTQGNDQDLFAWDIWTARTNLHRVRRLTTDGNSLYPSFNPSGTKIAFTKKDGQKPCTGSIWVMATDGTHQRKVAPASCARTLLRPGWLDAKTLVAWSWAPHSIKGLVTVDVGTGTVAPLINGKILDYSVSRALGQMAARFRGGAISLVDLGSEPFTVTPLPGTEPKGYRVFLSGALELAY
jgi:hypothetical protein